MIGWCMGGGYALDLAINDPKLAAAVINYGHLASEPETLKKINAPILGLFGGKDRGIPVEERTEICSGTESSRQDRGRHGLSRSGTRL